MLARAEPHGAGPLSIDARKVGLTGIFGSRAAAQEIDAVSAAACLFEIEGVDRSLHPVLERCDRVGHHTFTRESDIGRIAPDVGRYRRNDERLKAVSRSEVSRSKLRACCPNCATARSSQSSIALFFLGFAWV